MATHCGHRDWLGGGSAGVRRRKQSRLDCLKTEILLFKAGDRAGSHVLEMTPEGLRVNVFDRGRKPIFEQQSPDFTEYGKWVFSTLAWQVSRFPKNFLMELEGHTEAGHPPKSEVYGDWELTTDRANSARRLLLEHGVKSTQVRKVAGFADTKPIKGIDVTDPSNRRVTLLLRLDNHLD